LVRKKRIQGYGRPHDDDVSAYGVDGARQLAVVDSVAVVEEFEVVTNAMAQVHAMAVPGPAISGMA